MKSDTSTKFIIYLLQKKVLLANYLWHSGTTVAQLDAARETSDHVHQEHHVPIGLRPHQLFAGERGGE